VVCSLDDMASLSLPLFFLLSLSLFGKSHALFLDHMGKRGLLQVRESAHCCRRNKLSYTATHCNTLQHSATHCTTLHYTAEQLQHTATHCNTLQHTVRVSTHRWHPAQAEGSLPQEASRMSHSLLIVTILYKKGLSLFIGLQ